MISFPTIADSTPFYWLSRSYSKLSSSCNSRVSSYQKFSKLTFHDAVLTFDSSLDHLGVSTCWVGSFSLFFWLFGHCCMLFWLLSLLFGVNYSCSNKSSLRSLRRCYSLRSTLSNCIESPTNNRSLVYWIIKIIQPIFQNFQDHTTYYSPIVPDPHYIHFNHFKHLHHLYYSINRQSAKRFNCI